MRRQITDYRIKEMVLQNGKKFCTFCCCCTAKERRKRILLHSNILKSREKSPSPTQFHVQPSCVFVFSFYLLFGRFGLISLSNDLAKNFSIYRAFTKLLELSEANSFSRCFFFRPSTVYFASLCGSFQDFSCEQSNSVKCNSNALFRGRY